MLFIRKTFRILKNKAIRPGLNLERVFSITSENDVLIAGMGNSRFLFLFFFCILFLFSIQYVIVMYSKCY